MTIATTDNRVNHIGNAIITEFSFTFKVLDEAHIYPYLDTVVQSSGFTVALNADQDVSPGGSVTFTAAPDDGAAVTIERIVPNTQGIDYTDYDAFPADTHESGLDLLTMQMQQVEDKVDRATVAPVTDDGTADYTLPEAEALKLFRWNAAGDALENTDDPAVSASAALVSENNAATSESNAATSETNAATSETNAVTSETNAVTSETNAASSAVAAAASAAEAAISVAYKGDATGTVDVITAILGITALVDNLFVILRASGANATTTPTFNPDGKGAETIVKNGNQALDIGDIPRVDYEMLLKRNSTNTAWELMNPVNSGVIVQKSRTDDSAVSTGSTTNSFTDAIPTKTQGDEWVTAAITPKDSANILHVRLQVYLSSNSTGVDLIAALFKDTDTNAVKASSTFQDGTARGVMVVVDYELVAGVTSEIIFKVRVGAGAAGTVTVNGVSSGRIFGGVMNSFIEITERTP